MSSKEFSIKPIFFEDVLMKRISLFALVLLLGLPGCGNNKKKATQSNKRATIEQQVDMFGNIDTEGGISEEDNDEDDLDDLRSFDFDDEDEEFAPADKYGNDEDMVLDFEENDIPENEQELSWVDIQADDELKPLHFAFNSYKLNDSQKKALEYDIEQVKQLIAEVGSSAQPVVVAEGHADQEGSPSYNLALSEKRAKDVADLFVAAGIDKDIIKVVGRGQEVPVIINGKVVDGSREDRAPNRRVEIRVIYT